MLIALDVFEFNVAAINAVIVVPILAPMINGAASFNVAIFLATMGTTTDVVMVLERIAAVVSSPHANDLSWILEKETAEPFWRFCSKQIGNQSSENKNGRE